MGATRRRRVWKRDRHKSKNETVFRFFFSRQVQVFWTPRILQKLQDLVPRIKQSVHTCLLVFGQAPCSIQCAPPRKRSFGSRGPLGRRGLFPRLRFGRQGLGPEAATQSIHQIDHIALRWLGRRRWAIRRAFSLVTWRRVRSCTGLPTTPDRSRPSSS